MSEAKMAGRRGLPLWPKDASRVAFGIIGAIDAALKWLPGSGPATTEAGS